MVEKEGPDGPKKQKKAGEKQDQPVEKPDILALILAALSYVLPVFAAVLLLLVLILILAIFF